MSPPIDIDGSEIQEATIDGQDVKEITIDGQQAAEFIDIPDSAVAQYDATAISATDGNPLSSWSDQISGNDLSAVNAPTFRNSAINGNPAVEFDGSDDEMTAAIGRFSQPITYGLVYRLKSTSSTNNIVTRQSGSLQYRPTANNDFNHFDGNTGFIGGTPTTNNEIGFLIWDASNTEQYVNGSQISLSSGSTSPTDLVDLRVGTSAFDEFLDGFIGEIIIYDDRLTNSERTEEENRLSNKFGIPV